MPNSNLFLEAVNTLKNLQLSEVKKLKTIKNLVKQDSKIIYEETLEANNNECQQYLLVHYMIKLNQCEILKYICNLYKKQNPSFLNECNIPILEFTICQNNNKALKILLNNKLDPNIKNINFETPLYFMARNKNHYNKIAAKLLLKNKADVKYCYTNNVDYEGYTSLHFSLEAGNFELAKLLLASLKSSRTELKDFINMLDNKKENAILKIHIEPSTEESKNFRDPDIQKITDLLIHYGLCLIIGDTIEKIKKQNPGLHSYLLHSSYKYGNTGSVEHMALTNFGTINTHSSRHIKKNYKTSKYSYSSDCDISFGGYCGGSGGCDGGIE